MCHTPKGSFLTVACNLVDIENKYLDLIEEISEETDIEVIEDLIGQVTQIKTTVSHIAHVLALHNE